MNPVRGTGSAKARDDHQLIGIGHQNPFPPAVASAVSSADRRSTLRAVGDADDPGQGVRRPVGVADEVDQVANRDRPAAEFPRPHRGDRAPVACPRSTRQLYRPRSTAVTKPSTASRDVGRVLVRGRLPRGPGGPGRRRCPSGPRGVLSAATTGCRPESEHARPHPVETGQRLGGGRDVVDDDAGDPQPDDRAGRGHPVVGVGAPRPAVQRPRAGWSAHRGVRRHCRRPRRCRLPGRRSGRSRDPRRCPIPRSRLGPAANSAIAATVGVSSPTSCRSRSTPRSVSGSRDGSPSSIRSTLQPISARIPRIASPACVVARRPVRDGHRPAGDRGRREKRCGVGQVGLDRRRPRAHRTRLAPPRSAAGVVDGDPDRPQRQRPSSRCAAWTAPAARRGSLVTPAGARTPRTAAGRRRTVTMRWRRCVTSPPRHRAGAVDGERQASRRRCGRPAARAPRVSCVIGRRRAAASPSNRTVPSPWRPAPAGTA